MSSTGPTQTPVMGSESADARCVPGSCLPHPIGSLVIKSSSARTTAVVELGALDRAKRAKLAVNLVKRVLARHTRFF